jgi:hypothetical protein
MIYEEIAAGFAAGIVTGLTAAWGYWKVIPLPKKKAAFNKLSDALEDGELSISEGMDAIGELF